MPNFGSLEEIWRRSLDLNLRFYGALGNLTADYLKDIASTVSQVMMSQSGNANPFMSAFNAQPSPQASAPTAQRTAQQPGAMVLEGEAGGRVLGVFLVENHLSRDISARIIASAFISADGHEVRPVMLFDPETVILGPGEQLLVQVVALIDETLTPEVRYTGQFTIPELMGTRIPVVLRRRLSQNTSASQTAGRAQEESDAVNSKSTTARSRSAKAKR